MSISQTQKKQGSASAGGAVYRIEGHSIASEDETLDGTGTAPDRVTDPDGRVLEGEERRRFLEGIRTRLGAGALPGLSLPRLAGFFDAASRARDYLRDRHYALGLAEARSASRHAEDGRFLSGEALRTVRNLVLASVQPGLEAAEAVLRNPSRADGIWRLLNEEPFQSFRRRLTLQNLEREGVLEEETLQRIGSLHRELVERGVRAAPAYGSEVLGAARTPGELRAAWIVLSGLRNAATGAAISFDRREIDLLVRQVEARLHPSPTQLELMRALAE